MASCRRKSDEHWSPGFELEAPSSELRELLSLHRRVLADERGENPVEALLDFRIRQRAVVRLKRQSHRETDHAFGNALALIAVEEAERPSGASPMLRAARAGTRHGDSTRLAVGREARTDLEQPDIAQPVPAIVSDRIDETRE